MRLYFYGFIMLIKKFIFRKNTGEVINWFAKKMGLVYIKFAQILAMQNVGELFTEEDRKSLSSICDNCNPIKFKKIVKVIEKEYGCNINQKFKKVFEEPVGSASISQVHKAILKNGEVVAIKVKRQDVFKKANKDIKQIRKLIHRFGKLFNFKNYLAGDRALELYLDWIYQEIDFKNEQRNLIEYSKFAEKVNGKIPGTVKIVVPRLYKKMCTENIIVMEFIDSWTVNKLTLNKKNKEKIRRGLNDYMKLSFYALFHDCDVIFHGDIHGGNIYIDREGNVGFLDMGLTFTITAEEAKYIIKVFLLAYNNDYETLSKELLADSVYDSIDLDRFNEDLCACCQEIKNIPVTNYFINMISMFTKYNVDPPKIFFKMAKAFVALNGLNDLIGNKLDTEELIKDQLIEYFCDRTYNDFKDLVKDGINLLPNVIKKTLSEGFVKGLSDEIIALDSLRKKINNAFDNCHEMLSFFK